MLTQRTASLAAVLVTAGFCHAQCGVVMTQKSRAADGVAEAFFGFSVSMSGGTAIVGAVCDDDLGHYSGSVYVLENSGDVWTQTAKLTAADGQANDWFGHSVALSGDTMIAGAPNEDALGNNSGAAYVFERAGGVWTQSAKLVASDGADRDYFGASVSIQGERVIVGAAYDDDRGNYSGSAYLFEKIGGVWTQIAKLTATDGEEGDKFGHAVALTDEAAIVGAVLEDDGGPDAGAAYIFEELGGVWTQAAKLTADDGERNDEFGGAVSISGDTAVVGAQNDDAIAEYSGSAYVFERDTGGWTQTAKLVPSDGAYADFFGRGVSIEGDVAIVGSPEDDDLADRCGSAYVFRRSGGVWTQAAKFAAPDGSERDLFGAVLAVSGRVVLAGLPSDDDAGENSGSAYFFALDCCVDLTGDGLVDTRDFILFLNAWASGDPIADWDGNGTIDTEDFTAYLNGWSIGC